MDLWKDIQNADAPVSFFPLEGPRADVQAMEGFFHLLRVTLRHADKVTLPTLVKPIFAFFLDVFDLRHRLQKRDFDQVVSLPRDLATRLTVQVINEIEESAITSFLELVVRLNEVTFKPLFIRLYDWAVIDLSEGASESTMSSLLDATDDIGVDNARLVERKLVLLHVMMGLLQKFRVGPFLNQGVIADKAASALAIHRYPAATYRGATARLCQWLDPGRSPMDVASRGSRQVVRGG